MKNQRLLTRLNILEQRNKDLLKNKSLIRFIDSLPLKDQRKFNYPCPNGIIIFRGTSKDLNKIMIPFGDSGKKIIVDDI
jgi:hypothetical protein